MIKQDSLTRSQAMGIGNIYLDDEHIKNKDIIIGNKIIQARKTDNIRLLCVYKDLFLKTYDEGHYISLTDQIDFNNKAKQIHHASSWYLTNGIALPFSTEEERLKVVNVQELTSLGFQANKLSYKEAIQFLKKLNSEIEKKVSTNIRYQFGNEGIVQFQQDKSKDVINEVNKSISLILK